MLILVTKCTFDTFFDVFRQYKKDALARLGVRFFAAAFFLAGTLQKSSAFEVLGPVWTGATTAFHVDIPAPGGDPIWDNAFENAMAQWNAVAPFEFRIFRNSFRDPCSNPFVSPPANGVKFSTTVCGDAWGDTTIATALRWDTNNGQTFLQSGIIFNSNESWNVYSGPWSTGQFLGINDFKRVAIHELGHALGLDHEEDVPAIMASRSGDIEAPQQDDIDGAIFLYTEPDLIVSSISVTDNTLVPGQVFTINVTVKNQGTDSSSPSTLRYLSSTNNIILTSDAVFGTRPVDAIAPGETKSLSFDAQLLSAEGTFWLGACVDPVSREKAIENNCSIAVQVILADTDKDGVADGDDNCPLSLNPEQDDSDEDGLGDACDSDDDNDGLTDVDEIQLGTNPRKADTDNDGVSDPDEIAAGTDPTVNIPVVIQIINSILLGD